MKDISKNYLTIQGWMVSELKLKGNEILAFALINGFCQDGESEFTGSLNYVCSWLNCSRPTASKALDGLVGKGFIVKRAENISGVTLNRYKTIEGVKNLYGGGKESLWGGSKDSLHNKDNNNKDNNSNMSLSTKDDATEQIIPIQDVVKEFKIPISEIGILIPLKAKKAEKEKPTKEKAAAAAGIIAYLNERAGRSMATDGERAKANVTIINARIKEGYTVEEMKRIIDYKCNEWAGTDWAKFLKPSTLFIPKHISDYLEESQNKEFTPVQMGPVHDIDLNGQTHIYSAWWESVKSKYPAMAKQVPFLKASEFQDLRSETPKWAPNYWNKVGKGPHKKAIQECFELLERDGQERKKAKEGLFPYLTNYLKENVL